MIYHTEEEMNQDLHRQSLEVCRAHGFDVQQDLEDGHKLCGKAATQEFVDVYPDGSWEYKAEDEELATTGESPVMLKLFFVDQDTYRDLINDDDDEDQDDLESDD